MTMVAISPKEFEESMKELSRDGDIEERHALAEALMCDTLTALGYKKGIDVFESMTKWYA